MTKGKNYNPVLKTQCIRIPKEGMTATILRLKDGGNCTIHKHVCIKKKVVPIAIIKIIFAFLQ